MKKIAYPLLSDSKSAWAPPHRRTLAACAAMAMTMLASQSVQAIEIDTGNPDAVLRWDNTIRYNYGVRMKDRDPALIANPAMDDGNRNFAKGQAVTNRFDLFSELDLVVDKKYGFRLSAAAWDDAAYRNLATDANMPSFYNGSGGPNSLSPYSKRYAQGTSGELLDAFVFSNFQLNDTPVNARLGKHTAYWGEGMLLSGAIHSVSYGQYPLDIWKSAATPGTEAKELYRPRNGVTLQFQPQSDLSISAQTFFEWAPARVAESGTYLSGADAALYGGQTFKTTALAGPPQGAMVTPKNNGDWGLTARWSPEWLDGTWGFYSRRTSDIANQSWAAFNPGGPTVPAYHFSYARGINILGTSLNKVVNGVSVGAEVSMRENMPLVSQPANALALAGPPTSSVPAAVATSNALWNLANSGEVPGARGKTAHMVLNMTGILPRNDLFDIASVVAEFTWNRVMSVTSDPFNLYKGNAAYANGATAGAANIDGVTRDATTLGLVFTPSWLSALPETDISMPFSYNVGLSGQSGVTSGGAKNSGTWSIGLAADYKAQYNFALRYIAAFGPYTTTTVALPGVAPGAAGVAPGYAPLSDRDMLVFTFKTTF